MHELRILASDFAIVPGDYDVQAKWLVMMEVGDEDFVCHSMLLFLMGYQGPRADKSAHYSVKLHVTE